MNILIEPYYNGIIQTLFSLFLISGFIFYGNIINGFIFKQYKNILFNLLVSFVIFSQLIKILIYLNFFAQTYSILSFIILLPGVYNLKNFFNYIRDKKLKLSNNFFEIIIIITIFIFFIISISPPSMADALDYHYGIPLYLIKNGELPNMYFWVHGNLAGNGELINTLAIFLGTDNFGSLVQFFSLLLFLNFLLEEIKEKNKVTFLFIFILCSPTLLQLISGPKFLLLPQVLTASSLFLVLKKKKIEVQDFIFISILLMGAAQFKLSFILSGLVLGLFAFYKAFKNEKTKVLFSCILLFTFFFLPTAIWNYLQVANFNYLNFFSLVPIEMMKNISEFKENNFIYPLNLLFPQSLGSVTTIIGFQFFLLFLNFNKNYEFKIIIFITLLTICLHYFFSLNVSRIYYEFILWIAVGFYFLKDSNINYSFYTKIIVPQLLLVNCFAIYFVITSFSAIIFDKSRDNFMIKNSHEYQSIKWVNNNLPKNAKIISDLRSVSFFNNEFIPTDWLNLNLSNDDLINYFKIIKQEKFNYIVLKSKSKKNHRFENCIGNKIFQSPEFTKSTRNPFNRDNKYSVSIFEFKHNKLPSCVMNN